MSIQTPIVRNESLARFASYATSTAFNLSLSKRMVDAVMRLASQGQGSHGWGVDGLIKRGLAEPAHGEERKMYPEVRLTEAGMAVARLCEMAGLGVIEKKEG